MLPPNDRIIVLDGGFSSQLERDGVEIQGDPLWGASALFTHPQKVIDLHKKYLSAGAQIIETNSYQAAIPTLLDHFGKDNRQKAESVVRDSAHLARRAVQEFCAENGDQRRVDEFRVAGSIGPYATVLHDGSEYSGGYIRKTPPEQIYAYFKGQIEALLKAGVDILAFETVPTLAEAKIIIQVLATFSPVFAWISFTCRDGTYTHGGDKFSDVVSSLSVEPAVSMIGINCTGPQYVSSLLQNGSHSDKPFVVYPNSGEKWNHEIGWCSPDEHGPLTDYIPDWVRLGARIFGGCCRIGPEGIKEITLAVSKFSNLGGANI